MSRSPSIPDRPRLDLDPEMSPAERLSALEKHFKRIMAVNEELESRLSEATDQRTELHNEVSRLKKRNEALKTAALYIASVEELTDDGDVVIKQHGNNQEVLTEVTPELEDELESGDRVAINESFGIQQVLDDETDARAQAMEVTESPEVTYDDIGGIDNQVTEVREAVEDAIENPAQFDAVGIDPPSGVLLHGPPGTGKTMLAKAVANESDATFIKMTGSELVQKFIGEGARLVRDLFSLAGRTRASRRLYRRDRRRCLPPNRLKNLRRRRGAANDDAVALGDGWLR
ncbi:MAG: ATP-dependent 26S proteasome regulatory subunit [Halonotius sp. J07HN4]|nr:MAG: ATP-dependent 26S proteasome regulatory subunit [Halonotius sp. J07HN4]